MRVMFVKGPAAEADGSVLQQLRATAPELEISTTQGSAEAIAEIRKNPGWSALLVSSSLPQNETLALIATLRRDRVPMAIVPVVDEAQQELFAAAVASGADDILLRRGQSLVNVTETLARMRQSPHLFPVDERRRLGVIYAGRDPLVWNLLEQVPFVRAEKVGVGPDGVCPVRPAGSGDPGQRTDAVVIDEQPGDAHPLQVLKSVKAQASDLPVVMLTSSVTSDVGTAALELGADDTVIKTGIFRRRLIAALRRVHQRLELTMQQAEMKVREERLRQIVENVPTGITVISTDGVILAMNGSALRLFGATKPRDVVGRDFRQFVAPGDREGIGFFLKRILGGESASTDFRVHRPDGSEDALAIRGVVLERDARGTRGVIANITRTGADSPAPDDRMELSTALEALARLQTQRTELQDTHASEQAAWAMERAELERRLAAAEQAATEVSSASERLSAVTGELDRAGEAFAVERRELEARIATLEQAREAAATAAAQAATEASTATERLSAVSGELDRAGEVFAIERRELEARIAGLEQARDEAAAAASGRIDIEQALEAARADLEAARHLRLEDETRWDRTRRELEQRVAELESRQVNGDAIGELERQLREAREAAAAEVAAANEAREQLERELRGARETLWTEYSERDALRATFDSQLSDLRQLLVNERQAWSVERAELEGRTESIRAEAKTRLGARAEEHARPALAAQEHRRAQDEALRNELEALRQALAEAQASLADLAESHRREIDAERAARTTDLETLDATRQALDAAEGRAQGLVDAHAHDLAAEREARRQQSQELEALRQALTDADARVRALEAESHRTADEERQARQAAEAARQAAEEALAAADARGQQAAAEHAAAMQDLEARVQRELQALEETRRLLDEANARLDAATAAHDAQLADERAARESMLEEARRAWTDTEAALRADLTNAERTADAERESRAAREADLARLTERVADLERQLADAAHASRQELDRAVQALAAERDDALRTLATLRDERASLESRFADELERAEESARATVEEYDATRARLEGERQALASEVADLKRAAEAQQQEFERIRREAEEQRHHERAGFESRVSELEAALAQERQEAGRVGGLLQAVADAEHRLAELQAALDEAHGTAGRHLVALDEERARWQADRESLVAAEQARAAEVQSLVDARTSWDAARQSLETALDEANDMLTRERQTRDDAADAARRDRDAWDAERTDLANQLNALGSVAAERTALEQALQVLRSDYAAMVHALEHDRASLERERNRIASLEAALGQARERYAAVERELSETTNEAEALIRRREMEHTAELQKLERELTTNAMRLSRVAEEADRARATLQAEFTRAAESHDRLIASDLFGYAVTTLPGELVRCNDAFARLFGFADAPDAMTRTAGRAIPGLADRPALAARLATDGQVVRAEACLERIDGQPVRISQSCTLLSDPAETDGEALVEHVVLGTLVASDQAELRAERLEAVGALTNDMVPELEALVTTLAEQVSDSERDRRSLVPLAGQVAALIRQLGAFSRRQMLPASRIDLSQAVLSAEPTLLRLVGDYISFATDLEETGLVAAHIDDLDHLLTSLVTLGRDLLPAGGSIVVETRRHGLLANGIQTVQEDGPRLTVTASGYGVQVPERSGALTQVVERAGGVLRIHGEPGWVVRLDVSFPRCGKPKGRRSWAD